jgi:aminopeptidase N
MQRFSTSARSTPPGSRNAAWQVPVCIKTATSDAVSCQIVSGTSATITLEPNQCVPWAFLNAGANGYFRTAYSPAMLSALAPDIPRRLTEAERHALIGDEWALVQAGRHTIGEYMTLASGFGSEHASGVLEEIASRLQYAHNYLTTADNRPVFERFVQSVFSPLFRELGVEAPSGAREADDLRALRATVVDLVGNVGNDQNVPATARTALDRALSGQGALDATAARAIIRTAARRGDQQLWDRLLEASRDASSPGERYRYLYALASFEDPALADRGLNLSLTTEVRSQDTSLYLGRFIENPAIRARAWAFVKQHWTELEPRFKIAGGDSNLVRSLGSFCDNTAREDVRAFFSSHKLPAASRALDQTLERIGNCVAIRERQAPQLAAWLNAQGHR